MGWFRQGSVAKRVTISVIALYAFLLQTMLTAAGPAAAFDPSTGVTCSDDGSQSGAPGGERHHHVGQCCILVCAACACAYIATASGIVVFPARAALSFSWDQPPADAARPPLRFYFGARGPPQDI